MSDALAWLIVIVLLALFGCSSGGGGGRINTRPITYPRPPAPKAQTAPRSPHA
jgi:hypothetical protein